MRLHWTFLALVALASACDGQPASPTNLHTTITFPDADPKTGVLPLDVTHGFPLRVKVSTPLSGLQSALSAQVQLVAGPPTTPSAAPATAAPLSLTLFPDGTGNYSAIATLNAPGPGPVIVQADVSGSIGRQTAHIQPPVLKAAIAPTTTWNGSVPRYVGCVESSATAGSITLSSPDPAVIGAGTSPISLLPGPCPPLLVQDGPKTSHANFVVSFMPPFQIQATLNGMPNGADPGAWTVPISMMDPVVASVKATDDGGVKTAAGVEYTVTVLAESGSGSSSMTPAEGMSVSLSTSMGGTVTPASVTTDAMGKATAYVLIPPSTSGVVTLTATAGGAVGFDMFVPPPSSPSPVPTLGPTTFAMVADPAADGGTGTAFAITTKAMAGGMPAPGVTVSFAVLYPTGQGAPTVAPATQVTDANGNATALVALSSLSPKVQVEVSSGASVVVCDIPAGNATCQVVSP